MKITLYLFLIVVSLNTEALTVQQQLFKETYKKAFKGDEIAVDQGLKKLKNYRLNHYLEYALLRADITNLPEKKIAAFRKKHPKSPLNDILDEMLTYEFGKQKQWSKFLKRYNNKGISQTKHCWYLQARIATKDLKGLPKAITDTWLNGLSLPKACDPVFSWWNKQGHVSDELLTQRIKLAFQVNNASTARYLATQMINKPVWVDRAIALIQTPLKTLQQTKLWPDDADHQELVFIKSKYLAQKMPDEMHKLWPQLKSQFTFTAKAQAQVERIIALFAATDYLPFTINAMNDLPAEQHDAQIYAWKVRYYLYQGDWSKVIDTINAMPDFQRNKDDWQYWLARALAKTAQKDQAKRIFTTLASKSHYHGFLAADHMNLPYQMCSEDIAKESIDQMPGFLENAFELFAMDLIKEARKEWILGYRELNIGQRRALADIAYQKGWYNKVTAIMGALGLWKNYQLRYPLAYQNEIGQLSKKYQILPQWVMSIITQESAWQTDAISSADARGLMQLIDPTAKRLSKKLGLNYAGKWQLHEANFNLHLGIFYQRQLLDQFDQHPILALASYNAGESKAIDWLNSFPVAPDVWAETIPYRETRGYIKKILTNVTIYDWLINKQPRRISHWMPTFPVDDSDIKKWPNSKTAGQTTVVECQS